MIWKTLKSQRVAALQFSIGCHGDAWAAVIDWNKLQSLNDFSACFNPAYVQQLFTWQALSALTSGRLSSPSSTGGETPGPHAGPFTPSASQVPDLRTFFSSDLCFFTRQRCLVSIQLNTTQFVPKSSETSPVHFRKVQLFGQIISMFWHQVDSVWLGTNI